MDAVETHIAQWRTFVTQNPAVDGSDAEELETHLRDQMSDLEASGLSAEEAFLVAVRRLGSIDSVSREFAREHRERLWKQLMLTNDTARSAEHRNIIDALVFAIAVAVAVQVFRFDGGFMEGPPAWFLRSASIIVLPFLVAYFARLRALTIRQWGISLAPFVVALGINAYPFVAGSMTELLAAVHLPVALWFTVAYAYTGGEIGSHERRMDFVRFTGEWCIYFVLIALGGGVLMGLTALILEPTVGADALPAIITWVLPSGAAGAVIVAAWLVESKQQVVENMAPVLTMVFTPLFALMLVIVTIVYIATGFGGAFNRELLGVFDALLVVVLGIVLYGLSAREPTAAPGWLDYTQLVAMVGALALNSMVLGAMLLRIGALGFTPNRVAALGLNVVLLVNLVGATWWSVRFIRGHVTLHCLARWQTIYLPIFAAWAAIVVVVLPLLFAFT